MTKATYLGNHLEYTVTTESGALFAVDPHLGPARPPGTAVHVTFADRGVALVRR